MREARGRRGNFGAVLAVVAGLLAFGQTLWPTPAPQNDLGDIGNVWASWVHGLGVVIAGSPFLVLLRRSLLPLAKGLLILSGLTLIGTSIVLELIAGVGPLAMLFDVVPGVLAIAAGLLLGAPYRPEVDRARRALDEGAEQRRNQPPQPDQEGRRHAA